MQRVYKRILALAGSRTGQRFFHGTFWSVTGALVSRGSLFLATILFVRQLGRDGYGQLGYIMSTVNLFVIIGTCCLGYAASKIISESLETDKVRLERNLAIFYLGMSLLIVCTGACYYGLAPWLSNDPVSDSPLIALLRLSTPFLLLSVWMQFQAGVLAGFQDYSSIAKADIVSGLAMLIFPPLGAVWYGLSGVIVGLCLTTVLNCILNAYAIHLNKVKHSLAFRLEGAASELRNILTLCLPWLASGIIAVGAQWWCHNMLIRTKNGFSEMAVLAIAMQIHAIILFLPLRMSGLLIPILSEAKADKSELQRRKVFCTLLLPSVSATVLASLPFVFFPSQIFGLFGHDFATATFRPVLWATAILSILYILSFSLNQWFATEDKTWLMMLLNCLWMAVLLFTASQLMKTGYGAFSVIVGMVIAYVLRIIVGFFCFFISNNSKRFEKDKIASETGDSQNNETPEIPLMKAA